jgi:hypothetical protein
VQKVTLPGGRTVGKGVMIMLVNTINRAKRSMKLYKEAEQKEKQRNYQPISLSTNMGRKSFMYL